MHVMIVAPEDLPIPPQRGGSVQIYVSHLCEALSRSEDVQVTLVSPGVKSTFSNEALDYSHFIVERTSPDQYWRGVRKLIDSLHPQIIQVENRPKQALRLLRRFPAKAMLLNLHSTTFLGPKHITSADARRVLTSVRAVVCNSHDLAKTVRERIGLSDRWHPSVIYPGVTQPCRTPGGTELGKATHDPLRLLFVGRVIHQKGVHIAIDALKVLERQMPIELTVVGRTPPWERAYRRQIVRSAANANVTFTGFVAPNQLQDVYASHDILVCPSQKHEAFGLVTIEAMMNGLPVVASHIGGIPEAVGTEGGRLVKNFHNPSAFARAIRSLQDRQTYQQYSDSALKQAGKFTWTTSAARFIELYQKAVNSAQEKKHTDL
ncbi:glycosyltransferase family 4 protein [Alicyclobacillus fastidiosus]|uniref:Glycosyltransferase family 4 protein n=1 Tax=Alicyclobacillus fastidiosus TaxID=392011 RepID=A0ABY6ZE29_9BACL|nr:glycosyltransferase family 4 protein [Alicyclobacillus fastidiosus]WAH40818.1 glycosyltransferase family 4 protein [Alicyclobacillus fastidiosus]